MFEFFLRMCMRQQNNPVIFVETLPLGDCWCYSKVPCQHINLADNLTTTAVPQTLQNCLQHLSPWSLST